MPEVIVDVVSDVVCPWCYIGRQRLEQARALAPDIVFDVRWRPFQLDATIPPEGIARTTYMLRKFGSPERIAEVYGRVTAATADAGLSLHLERISVSPNTLDAHRLLRWAYGTGLQDSLAERLFRLYFVEGGNLADRSTLSRAAGEVGLDSSSMAARLDTDEDSDAVRDEIGTAQRIGVTGVPFFIFDGRLGLSGAQPANIIVSAARQALAPESG